MIIGAVNIPRGIGARIREKRHPSVIEKLIHDKPQRVNVHRIVIGLSPKDFRRHVGDRADSSHCLCHMYRIHPLRCAKITHLVIPEPVYKQVRRLDITMDNTLFLTVHQRPADVRAQLPDLPDGGQRSLPVPSRQDFLQALEQFHPHQKSARLSRSPVSKVFYTDNIRCSAQRLHDLDLAAKRIRDIGLVFIQAA